MLALLFCLALQVHHPADRAAEEIVVSGRIVDAQSRTPVPGASVNLRLHRAEEIKSLEDGDYEWKSMLADANGKFEFVIAHGGDLDLDPVAGGYTLVDAAGKAYRTDFVRLRIPRKAKDFAAGD